MQAGFSRMNDLTVIQASQGLAEHIVASVPTNASIVIGYDHRHNSSRFARLAAAAMIQRGIRVYFYTSLVHTPLVPFGVKLLGASAGVMITASHNPAQDNGYKVYWSNACQIISPHDKAIAAAIERNLAPVCWDEGLVDTSGLVEKPVERVQDVYFRKLVGLVLHTTPVPRVRAVFTPLHGVGLLAMQRAARDLGVAEEDLVIVKEQQLPDADFPTVRFPNPEEAGTLDLAIATATENDISIVLATDPDADRFAVAERLPSGEWRTFTGNELGILFASHVLDNFPVELRPKLYMLCSTVSSQMLASMAKIEGFRFEETLTGFKWLGNRAQALEKEGYSAAYAFEEAIGYMFTPLVQDKDGIAAATVFISAVRDWSRVGLTPYQKLQELYGKYGYFKTANSYFVSRDAALTRKVFAGIRAAAPQAVGSRKITRWRDLTVGVDTAAEDGKPTLPTSKSSEMITAELDGGVRFTVRGSGTEPKIKSIYRIPPPTSNRLVGAMANVTGGGWAVYIECKADTEAAAIEGAKEVASDLTREWFRPEETGLKLP